MKTKYLILSIMFLSTGLINAKKTLSCEVFETSAQGNKLTKIKAAEQKKSAAVISLNPQKTYQTIVGFGGAFTESSAYLLNKISKKNRDLILNAYFSKDGADYSLTRTHINSCDFSLGHYAYDTVAGDMDLKYFSIAHDKKALIPMIKGAMAVSKDGFKILASPWTAPTWMKDNKDWRGGHLLPEYYDTWALYFSKYIDAYQGEGIPIWAFTVENEPLGCGDNWESMHFSPEEMTAFVGKALGPKLRADGHDQLLLGYDQNRGDVLKEWADVMYKDKTSSNYYGGMAIHWYASTYEVFGKSLQYVHNAAPDKLLLQTEACIDGQVPAWKDDAWYWAKEAKDWGWDWAPADQKYLHPKYVPAFRYAHDIIGCLNNWVNGWIDWNMVLDEKGGPNWFKNWCGAPILVNTETDEVYITPLYYVMAHFSKFIRPEAKRIDALTPDTSLEVTAVENLDKSIVVVVFNPEETEKEYALKLGDSNLSLKISAKALQTIVIRK